MKKKLIALLCTAGLLLTTAAIAAQAELKPTPDARLADTSDALDILKCLVGLTDPLPLDPTLGHCTQAWRLFAVFATVFAGI